MRGKLHILLNIPFHTEFRRDAENKKCAPLVFFFIKKFGWNARSHLQKKDKQFSKKKIKKMRERQKIFKRSYVIMTFQTKHHAKFIGRMPLYR